MNQNYSSALAAMEHYVELVRRLANSMQRGQEALVRMDLAAFEQLTGEQEALCAELVTLQKSAGDAFRPENEPNGLSGEAEEFSRQRAVLREGCRGIQERVRHLNRVNQIFLNRARRSLELLLRLAMPGEATYSAPAAVASAAGCPVGRE
jgi:hypothetical protein